ncbi:MAG: hypothetical protein ACREFT_03940, partial [Acetobacteraceae bacterium]
AAIVLAAAGHDHAVRGASILRGTPVSPAKTESSAPETLGAAAAGCTGGLISQFDAIGSGAASVPAASHNRERKDA